jgi:response regulator of citrate/malate metabolism
LLNLCWIQEKCALAAAILNIHDCCADVSCEQTDYFTANQIAKRVGVSRVTARRYLNYLNDNGWLKGILSYGPVGRPLHKYTKHGSFLA